MFKQFFDSLGIKKVIVIICALGLGVYFLSLFNGFVWDDTLQIVHNGDIQSIKNIPGLFLHGQLGVFYRPVFFSLLAVFYSLFNLNTFPYHFIQLSVHIGNTILIFLLYKKFIDKRLSFLLSLLFLVHPINVEAVAYISAISDPLFVFFGLASLHLMMKERENVFSVVIASLFILLSILVKEAGFLFLIIILVYRLLFKRKNLHLAVIFVTTPMVIYSYLRFFVAHTLFSGITITPLSKTTLIERFLTMPKIIFFYISTFVIPIRLAIAREWVVKSATLGGFYIPLIVDLCLIVVLVWIGISIYRRQRKLLLAYLFFSLWFLIGLSMYLQVVPLDVTVAERWFYLPMIGLLGVCGLFIGKIAITDKQRSLIYIVLVLVIGIFSLRSLVRTINWYDAYTLYTHDEKISNDNYLLKNNVAVELLKRGEDDTALKYAEDSMRLNPGWGTSWSTTGIIYFDKKDYPKAIYYLRESLNKDGGNYAGFYFLSESLLYSKNYTSAKGWIETGLKVFPNNESLIELLAMAEYNLGNQTKALDLAQQAVSLSPGSRTQTLYNAIFNKQPAILLP